MKHPWTLGLCVALATACVIESDDDDDDAADDAATTGVDDDDGDDDDGDDVGTTGDDDTGGDTDATAGETGTDTGADTGGTDTGGAATCEDYEGAATPDQVAMTPREDEEAELLTLEATEQVVAPEATYLRVLTDLDAIRELAPDLEEITARASYDPSALLLEVDDATADLIQDGTYDAWECPNTLYRVSEIDTELLPALPFVVLTFEGRFYIPALVPDYTELEGVISAEPDGVVGDGNDVCLSIEGETHTYVFDEASGDCPAGCIDHTYWGFEVDPEGNVTALGMFSNEDVEPGWFADLDECTQWL